MRTPRYKLENWAEVKVKFKILTLAEIGENGLRVFFYPGSVSSEVSLTDNKWKMVRTDLDWVKMKSCQKRRKKNRRTMGIVKLHLIWSSITKLGTCWLDFRFPCWSIVNMSALIVIIMIMITITITITITMIIIKLRNSTWLQDLCGQTSCLTDRQGPTRSASISRSEEHKDHDDDGDDDGDGYGDDGDGDADWWWYWR